MLVESTCWHPVPQIDYIANMKVFHFTVQVHDAPPDLDLISDDIYEAGCDDALLHMTGEEVFLSFHREAESLDSAIESAIRDIQTAGFQKCAVIEIEEDPAD